MIDFVFLDAAQDLSYEALKDIRTSMLWRDVRILEFEEVGWDRAAMSWAHRSPIPDMELERDFQPEELRRLMINMIDDLDNPQPEDVRFEL